MASKMFLSIMLLFVLASSAPIGLVGASSEMWSKTYGSGVGYSLVETSDGGFAIAGGTGSFGAGGNDFWLVKTDSYGNMEWNRTYSDSPSNYCSDLVETNDGGYLLAGGTGRYLLEANVWIIKTDEQGNIEWNQRYGGREHAGAKSVVKTSDGRYALAGYLSQDFWLIKIDVSGNIEWNQTYSKSGVEEAYSLVETSDGGYALAGITSGAIGDQSYIDSWMVKTDASGNEIWTQTYGGTGDQYLYSLVETSDGAFALAGFKTSTYAGPPDLWLIKTDEYGNIPEFPSWIIFSLFLVVTLSGVILRKKFRVV